MEIALYYTPKESFDIKNTGATSQRFVINAIKSSFDIDFKIRKD